MAGAESKDSPRGAPTLNLANFSLLPGYTVMHAKPVSGDQEPNHRQICLRDVIIADTSTAQHITDEALPVRSEGLTTRPSRLGTPPPVKIVRCVEQAAPATGSD